ncbi:MAG: nucleotidyltransferase domain-containing protein [Candidatus Woesearchaeota archaeon]
MILEELKKKLKSEKGNVFDIIIYGSLMKGKTKPNDIDVIVVFNSGTLKERLGELQSIKSRIRDISSIKIDAKQILLKDLFAPEFMARTGIMLEGYSVFREKGFSETLGFKAFSIFCYSISEMSHSQKVKFNYILAGRGDEGLIKILDGERMASGAIKIPIRNSIEFEEFLKKNNVKFSKKNVLEEI